MKNYKISFKPSEVHQGHYVYIDDEEAGLVINLHAYETLKDYRKITDQKISKAALILKPT